MSTTDITLNGKSFSLASISGRELARAISIATLPSGVDSGDLIIGHAPGVGTKADRHVVKFTRTVLTADGKPVQIGMHTTLVIPKGLTKAVIASQISGENSMSDDLATLLTTDTYDFSRRIANNEFS